MVCQGALANGGSMLSIHFVGLASGVLVWGRFRNEHRGRVAQNVHSSRLISKAPRLQRGLDGVSHHHRKKGPLGFPTQRPGTKQPMTHVSSCLESSKRDILWSVGCIFSPGVPCKTKPTFCPAVAFHHDHYVATETMYNK